MDLRRGISRKCMPSLQCWDGARLVAHMLIIQHSKITAVVIVSPARVRFTRLMPVTKWILPWVFRVWASQVPDVVDSVRVTLEGRGAGGGVLASSMT